MTVPQNLFIDAPDVQDETSTKLPPDIDAWPGAIISKLKERVPLVANLSLSLKFMKMEEEIGTATGSVTATEGSKVATIPLIVKDFYMYPMDVFMIEGKILPLSADYFSKAMFDPGKSGMQELTEYPVFGGFDKFVQSGNLMNSIFPPNWGRYSFASEEQIPVAYPLLSTIHLDGESFAKKLAQDETTFVRFCNNGHKTLLSKVAQLTPVNLGEFGQSADKLVRDIHVLSKEGPHSYNLLSSNSSTFSPMFTSLDRAGCTEFTSRICEDVDSAMHELDQTGQKILLVNPPSLKDGPFIFEADSAKVESADAYGIFNVKTKKTGVNDEGLVVPLVIDFAQNPIKGMKLFVGKGSWCLQENIYGVAMPHSEFSPCSYEGPQVGATGTFIFREKNKAGLATIPVTIKSMMKVEDMSGVGSYIEAVDFFGNKLSMKIPGERLKIERITPMFKPSGETIYLIPSKMEWTPLDYMEGVTDSPYEYATKFAAHKKTAQSLKVIRASDDCFAIRGMSKLANTVGWDSEELSKAQTSILLASLGADESLIKKAFAMSKLKAVEIHNIALPEAWSEKVASILANQRVSAGALEKHASSIRTDLIKEASYMQDAQTVDSLLSLNFVSPDNIAKFISKLGMFKSCISHLCSCLIASRLGMQDIPEQACSSAITKLIDVVRGLELIRATVQGAKN
jgi:hypothetical protein